MTGPDPFDVLGPLPSGVTVLEASAGTGKTFTIAALAARYVADGIPLDQMLLVTFGRMATGELRSRVRERLVTAEAGLATAMHGIEPPAGDEVLTLLSACPADQLALRRDRIAAAVAHFDAATIATTHGFCQQVLIGLGVAGDMEDDVTFVEDLTDLIDEVVDDLYLRKFGGPGAPVDFTLATARKIGREVMRQPSAVLVPATAPADSTADLRWRLAGTVRREVEARKRRMRILTYDDLLTRLATTLRDPVRGTAAAHALRERFSVVMIDEFQDTDPVQWEIVDTAFGGGETTLVLIGDPKQAIYAFRGADVHTYLAAAAQAGTTATLSRNWRSDHDLVTAFDALFDGAALGHPGIQYRTVEATEAHRSPRLRNAPNGAALRMRIAHRSDGRIELTPQHYASNKSARRDVAEDLAADIVELLSSPAEVLTRDANGEERSAEPIGPGHIAVLVSTHRHGALVRDALETVGVPAVISGAGSVFGTPVARDWAALLEALERPSSVGRVRAAALSTFIGWSAERVATADEESWETVYVRLHEWAAVLRARDVASLLELLMRSEQLPARLLAHEDGERELTDLRHIGQLLHHEAVTERLGINALTAWLRERIDEARDDVHDEDRSRRLDSDSEAVQVLTIHRCKGLEFPIVYCPFLWHPPYIPKDAIPVFPDRSAGWRRTIDVGGADGPDFDVHRDEHVAEVRGEALRLAYVAMTRACHQVVLHWASTYDSRESALARILFPSEFTAGEVELGRPPEEQAVVERMQEVAGAAPGCVSVERTTGARGVRWTPPAAARRDLEACRFDRTIDWAWRRTSYSGLTSMVREPGVASEAEATGTVDEDIPVEVVVAGTDEERDRLGAVPLPLAAMPGGARVGTLVHAVLEHTDFAAPILDAELRRAIGEQLVWDTAGVGPVDVVVDGLALAIGTPLGPSAGGLRLRDIAVGDRLDELAFELPLVGGDTPSGELGVGALADLFDAHVAPDDPVAGYGERLRDPLLGQQLHGYLAGTIDAVLRLPGADGGPARYAVVDYKTNWLAPAGAEISAWNYRPEALAVAMQHAHYPLQALFYVVALHRYLRWRVPDYDPDVHLAGVLYLFVRGMIGPETPTVGDQPCGVFSWRPPSKLVLAASELFDRGTGAA